MPVIQREIRPSVQPSRAVERLLDESRRHYDTGQWQAAIASAERGLRVDRREPELYLLLAKSYNALGDRGRALEFARQGLRYTPDRGSRVAGALDQMKTILEYKP